MKIIETNESKLINGGAKRYKCPWCSYSSTNYWSVYANAVWCGYRHGYFNPAIRLILLGLGA